jgi:glycerol kinase
MPGASEQTRRVKILNANWAPGDPEQFSVLIITDDDQRHIVPASPASVTALATLAQADTVMAWDPEGGTLIVANIVGQMPWTKPSQDS